MKLNGKLIGQNPTAKLLAITFDCNLNCSNQIIIITKWTYGALAL